MGDLDQVIKFCPGFDQGRTNGRAVNAQSGVSKSLEPGKAVTGSPAYDYTSALRSQAVTRKLPELEKRIMELEALVKQLLTEKSDIG